VVRGRQFVAPAVPPAGYPNLPFNLSIRDDGSVSSVTCASTADGPLRTTRDAGTYHVALTGTAGSQMGDYRIRMREAVEQPAELACNTSSDTITHEALINTWDHDSCPDCMKAENGKASGLTQVADQELGMCVTCNGTGRIAGTGKAQDWMHTSKTRDTLIRSIVWYLEKFKDDPMQTVILSDGRAAVEYSFSVELSADYLYCGHIDRLVLYSDDIYVQDQKTTGASITPRFFDGFSPDYQMTGYTWAGQISFAMPVKGVVVDAAYIAVGFTDFGRGFVSRSDRQLEEFHVEVLNIIERAKRCHETGYYPMNRTSCGNYGGCEFRRVCSAVPGIRDNLLEGSFVKRDRWDPLKRR
jgi:hypothetical protein